MFHDGSRFLGALLPTHHMSVRRGTACEPGMTIYNACEAFFSMLKDANDPHP